MGRLEAAVRGYIAETNAQPEPFVWIKSADEILADAVRLCELISESDH